MNRETIKQAALDYIEQHYPAHHPFKEHDVNVFTQGARHVLDRLCRLPWNEAIKELAEYAEEKNTKIAAVQAAEERMKLKIKQIQENEQNNQVQRQRP